MKSTLIKDTTKEERIALIREWIPDDDGMEDCDIDLWDMYRDYIDGKREIAEINAAFQTDYLEESMIRQADLRDAKDIAKLAVQMWKEHTVEELKEEFTEIIAEKESAVFLKIVDGEIVGFAQCQLRHDYVEGTHSSPVGYLEGIFVLEHNRKRGYAKELLRECEKWAKEQGCMEFASDCELHNQDSFHFHMNMGFEEANRVICFTKKLENV